MEKNEVGFGLPAIEQERLKARIKSMMDCKTPEELSYNIWTLELEKAMGSSRDPYRIPFVDWITKYRDGGTPQWSSYETPMQLADGIWKTFRGNDPWIKAVKAALVDWIDQWKEAHK